MTAPRTPAGRLVAAFGDVETMAAMYAPDVEWSLSASLSFPRPMVGRAQVEAFNREVWTVHYRADCQVRILDEVGDETGSAARFLYSAHSNILGRLYENEYAVFVRCGPAGITHVFESLDTALLLDIFTGRPAGTTVSTVLAELRDGA